MPGALALGVECQRGPTQHAERVQEAPCGTPMVSVRYTPRTTPGTPPRTTAGLPMVHRREPLAMNGEGVDFPATTRGFQPWKRRRHALNDANISRKQPISVHPRSTH